MYLFFQRKSKKQKKMADKLNAIQRLFRFTGMEKTRGYLIAITIISFNLGSVFDRSDTNRMIFFRDRSQLYGGHVKEGQPPSWPSQEQWWT